VLFSFAQREHSRRTWVSWIKSAFDPAQSNEARRGTASPGFHVSGAPKLKRSKQEMEQWESFVASGGGAIGALYVAQQRRSKIAFWPGMQG